RRCTPCLAARNRPPAWRARPARPGRRGFAEARRGRASVPGSSWHSRGPSRRGRRRRNPAAARCGASPGPPFFGELRVDPLAEPGLVLAPAEALVDQEFVDPAPLDRDPLLLIEVSLQAVERPAAEGQAELLRVGQGGGDHLGALLGGVGVRPAATGTLLQPPQALLVEPADPGIDGRPGAAQARGDLAGCLPLGGRLDD